MHVFIVRLYFHYTFCTFLGHTLANSEMSQSEITKKPNFLIIVADDLGWSDTSPFGGEINTPNIQMLADGGVRFTDFHTASACSPTRAMLLSGTDHHIAGLGQMAEEIINHPDIWEGKSGYEGYLNDRVAALPEIMQDADYFTTMSGKWHLGITPDRIPAKRGFDDSFSLLPGAGNHYAYEIAGSFLPPVYVRNSTYIDYETLEDFYSSDYFATELIKSLQSNVAVNKKPFFAYLPFTAPHWPLQAPPEIIAKYKGIYDDGPSVLRKNRLETQRKLGLILSDIVSSADDTDEDEEIWKKLTPAEKAYSAKTMEIYAAMVERMDFAIGRVIDYLKESEQFENTFILFMSDNGAEGASMDSIPISSTWNPDKFFNNSYENIGNKDSFVTYGFQWAQAAVAPSRRVKGHITEGGIRCPAIVHYPRLFTSLKITDEFTTVMDILPTVLEFANIPHPGTTFRKRAVVTPRGKSWVPYLFNPDGHKHVHSEYDFTGWELFGERAIRRGNYKAILVPNESNTARWELYDLSRDKGELINLADERGDVLKELVEAWFTYETETGVILAEDGWAVRYSSDLVASKRIENVVARIRYWLVPHDEI